MTDDFDNIFKKNQLIFLDQIVIFPPQNLKAAMFLHLKTIVGDTLVDDSLVNEKGGLDETSEDKNRRRWSSKNSFFFSTWTIVCP